MSATSSPVNLVDRPPSDATPAVYPRRFGARYVLLKELGAGGMGQVFLATTGSSGAERVCALKIMRQLDAPGRGPEELGKRFLDEAQVVTKLSHENLVYVFDAGLAWTQVGSAERSPSRGGAGTPSASPGTIDSQQHLYLGMEYVRGKSLTELWNRCALRGVGFPMGVALHAATELASGLAYAHGLEHLGLVHRDISPSNLMLTYTGGVKLIDFGLAKWKSKMAQTATGVNWGKVSYMSPEQYTGRPIDHRSDLFSLAVILWELLTGKQLFPSEAARTAMTDLPPPSEHNPHVSEALDRVVLKALAFEPDDRFESADQFAAALAPHVPRDAGKRQLAQFMAELFDADARAEAEEEERLVADGRRVSAQPAEPSTDVAVAPPAMLEPSDPIIGQTLEGRYFVRRLVGEGAMGRVYEGHHTGVGRRVAIKIPRNPERRRAELLQRFRLEANAASQIRHPNIADVTDCGTTPDGRFFFVMEFIDGVDLDKVIRRDGPLAIERALLIGVQVCRALEAAHKAAIIHRDLKPSNVMLLRDRDDNDQVKVLDFGVAKFLRAPAQGSDDANLTLADAAIGTPRYMAPEQIAAGQDIDFRVDIYAVGGVLYAMLSGGRPPVEGDSVQEVWRKKLDGAPVPLRSVRSDVPAELERLVMRCLARDPRERPQSMEALRRELVSVLERVRAAGSSVMGMKVPSETARVPPTSRRTHRLVVATAAAATLLVAGAGAFFLVDDRAAPPTTTTILMPAAAPPAPQPEPLVPPPAPPPAAVAAPASPPPAVAAPASPPPRASAPMERKPVAQPAPARAAAEPNAEQLLDAADDAFRQEHLSSAIALGKRAIAAGAGAPGWTLVGRAHYSLGDLDAAWDAYQHAAALAPNDAAIARAIDQLRAKRAARQP